MKRLIGCVAMLCLAALMAGCGGSDSGNTVAYVANSTGTGGFTAFNVNSDGTLSTSNASPISTPAAPTLVQFSPNGKWAYWLGNDPNTGVTSIYAYSRAGNGRLNPITIAGQQQLYAAPTADALAISPNSRFLYVALPGVLGGELAIYSIDQNTGLLSQVLITPYGYQFTQLLIDPNGNVLYALAPTQQTVVTFTLNSTSGLVTGPILPTVPMPSNPAPQGMILSANGSFLYVVDETNTVPATTSGAVGGASVSVTGQSPEIFGYLTSSSGTLSRIPGSPFHENADLFTQTFPTNPVAGVTSTDSRYLFIANRGSHNISVFQIDNTTNNGGGNTGELSEVLGTVSSVGGVEVSTQSPFDCGVDCTPSAIAISPKNNAIYVLSEGQFAVPQTRSAIFQFAFDPNTGRLRALNPASLDLGTGTSPTSITIR